MKKKEQELSGASFFLDDLLGLLFSLSLLTRLFSIRSRPLALLLGPLDTPNPPWASFARLPDMSRGGNGSPNEEGSEETESDEEGEEVNQLVDEDDQEGNQDEPMEEAEEDQEHYNALFSMDFVETKYPHDDTMRDLGIFEDVELVLKNMQLGKFFSHRMESYKESLVSFWRR
ncbi:unnamed protein product [Microthlaspi erraticum]|uniref:Arabidopsis retrotransposon Orf1 C-terminal domain-containing protein n=1 Tax=Microthlaspi erraticum TaxID=1685480 RepID=A0A6D2JYI4_9BRAS|nr:unnamed protein product [Microthlaspi erraticum]